MKVIFAHGKEGSPKGTKATYFRELFDAITPDLHGKSLIEQVEILESLVKENLNCLLVGSSMGGAAATLTSQKITPKKLLLLAPALHYEECKEGIPKDLETVIIHGVNDDIIPHSVSERAASLGGHKLILVEDDHRLSSSKEVVVYEVKTLLESLDT